MLGAIPRGRIAAYCILLALLAGCDQRPLPRVELTPDAPAVPVDAAFQQLPSRNEVLSTAEASYQYWRGLRLSLPREAEGLVRWAADDGGEGHYWTYQPPLRVYGEVSDAVRYPEAVKKATAPLRWQFRDGGWKREELFTAYPIAYRGVPEPSAAQVIALLQQLGIGYLQHRFAAVPDAITLVQAPRWPRDEEGFARLRAPVEFTAMVPLLDPAAGLLQNHEVSLRAVVRLDAEREQWLIDEEIAMLSSRFRFSTPMSSERQAQMRTEMDRFWRGAR